MFQIWEYRAGHQQLLIRSPKDEQHERNVDIVFAGVEYVDIPAILMGIDLAPPTTEDLRRVERRHRPNVDPSTVCVLVSGSKRHLIVAAGWKLSQNDLGPFESSLESFQVDETERRRLLDLIRERGDWGSVFPPQGGGSGSSAPAP